MLMYQNRPLQRKCKNLVQKTGKSTETILLDMKQLLSASVFATSPTPCPLLGITMLQCRQHPLPFCGYSKTINTGMAPPFHTKRGAQFGQETSPIQAWQYPSRQMPIREQNANSHQARMLWVYTSFSSSHLISWRNTVLHTRGKSL